MADDFDDWSDIGTAVPAPRQSLADDDWSDIGKVVSPPPTNPDYGNEALRKPGRLPEDSWLPKAKYASRAEAVAGNNAEYVAKPQDEFSNAFMRSAGPANARMFGQTVLAYQDLTDDNSFENDALALEAWATEAEKGIPKARVSSLADIHLLEEGGAHRLGDYVKQSVGSGVGSSIVQMAGGLAGGFLGSRALGKWGAAIGSLGGAFAGSNALQIGEMRKALIDEGMVDGDTNNQREAEQDRERRKLRGKIALAGGLAMATLDTALPAKLAGKLTGPVRDEIKRGLARRLMHHVLSGAKTEGLTEAAQQIIEDITSKVSTGKDLDTKAIKKIAWNALESGTQGALTGGVLEGGVQAASELPGVSNLPPMPPPSSPLPGVVPPPPGGGAGGPPGGSGPAGPPIGTTPPPIGQAPRAPDDFSDLGTEVKGTGDRKTPLKVDDPGHLDAARVKVNTEPSEAQKAAGNYKKAHVNIQGLDVAIENPKGSKRTGKAPDGTEWSVTMPGDYGYVKRTEGADGDQVDVFIGPDTTSDRVFVIDQTDLKSGKFDEGKAIIGTGTPEQAAELYHRSFSDGKGVDRIGNMVEMTVDQFKDWTKTGDTKAPLKGGFLPKVKVDKEAVRAARTGLSVAKQPQAPVPAPGTAKPAPQPANAQETTTKENNDGRTIEGNGETGTPPDRRTAAGADSGGNGEADGTADGANAAAGTAPDEGPGGLSGRRAAESGVGEEQPEGKPPATAGRPQVEPEGDKDAVRPGGVPAGKVAPKPGETPKAGRVLAPDRVAKPETKAKETVTIEGEAQEVVKRPAITDHPSSVSAKPNTATNQEKPASARKPIARRDMGDDVAVTSSGRDVPVGYAIVEASDLIASQADEGGANPSYPAELQPRDRERAVSQQQVQDIANKLNPRLLDKSAKASDGAPIIAEDGVVESGNGRTLAIRRAYQKNLPTAQAYREHLAAQGYPVEGMKQPVLVRVRKGELAPDERQAFTREANERDTLDMSAPERATADASAMGDGLLDLYRGGEVAAAGNRDFVRAFIRDVVSKNDQAGMIAADGSMSQGATRRLEAALLAKAYGDQELVATLVEAQDNSIKAIGGALMDVAPMWAKMRAEAKAGEVSPDVDLTQNLLEAVRLVEKARLSGQPLAMLVGQQDIFSGSTIAYRTEAFLSLMFDNTTSWKVPIGRDRLADALRFYVEEGRKTSPGTDLLGETAASPEEILALAKKKQQKGQSNEKPQDNLDLRPAARKDIGEAGGRNATQTKPRNEAAQGEETARDGGKPEVAPKPEAPAKKPTGDQASLAGKYIFNGTDYEEAARKKAVKPLAEALRIAAASFGYKIVDTGLPFGYTDHWGKFWSFGTQIIDKAIPGDALHRSLDNLSSATPAVRAYIKEHMTAPWFHRVWFGHDPLANLGTIIDKFGVEALPGYFGGLLKDSLTKAGIPLPGVQWLVQSGLVGDRFATAWMSLNIGEALSGGLSILGTYRLMKQAKSGEDIHHGWAIAGVLFKTIGGVLSANPVVLLSAAADVAILVKARAVRAGLRKLEANRKPGDQATLSAKSLTPVATLTGKELMDFGGPTDMPALRAKAIAWYDSNLRGANAVTKDGREVRFTRKGMGKTTSSNKGDVLLRSVPAIRAIVEKGDIIHREPGNRPGVEERLIISAPVVFLDRTVKLAVSVHRAPDGHYQYDFTFDREAGNEKPRINRGGLAQVMPLPSLEVPHLVSGELNLAEVSPDFKQGEGGQAPNLSPAQLAKADVELQGLATKWLGHRIRVSLIADNGSGNMGEFKPDSRLIHIIAKNSTNFVETLGHEALHGLRDLGVFTHGEWSLLKREAAKVRWDGKPLPDVVRKNYDAMYRREIDLTEAQHEEVLAEEAVAYMVGMHAADVLKSSDSRIGKIIDKFLRFLEAVRNLAKGYGFKTGQGVIKDILAGHFRDRMESEGPGRGFKLLKRGGQDADSLPQLPLDPEITTEEGADGKPQLVLPGAEKVPDAKLTQMKADAPLKPTKGQKDMDFGLFGDDDKQASLFMVPPDDGGFGIVDPLEVAAGPEAKEELADLAGNINLRRINAPEDIKALLKQVADDAGGFIAERRGVVSNEQTAALAAELGMSSAELLKRQTGAAFNAHGIFAARTLLRKSAFRLKSLAKVAAQSTSITDLAEFQKALLRHRAIQEQVAGLTAEAGRALQQFKMITGDDYLRGVDAILSGVKGKKAGFKSRLAGEEETAAELAKMIASLDDPAQLGKFVAESYKVTKLDMLREYWINALLSGPDTHSTNFLSNLVTALWQVPETGLASAIGAVRGGERVRSGEAMARLYGLVAGSMDGLRAAAALVITGESPDPVTRLENQNRRAIPGKIGSVIRTPGLLMEAADQFFKMVNSRAELHALAVRMALREQRKGADFSERVKELLANPSRAMTARAREAALYNTFQTKLGPATQTVMNLREIIPGAWLILPFIRTGVNLVKYATERTPLALASRLLPESLPSPVRDNLTGKNGREAQDTQIARIVMGTGLMVGVVALVSAGLITGGGPDDKEEKDVLRATGWQPYSVKVNGAYYSYQRFDPFALIIGITADMVEAGNEWTEVKVEKIATLLVSAIAETMRDKLWFRGPSQFFDAFFGRDSKEKVGAKIERYSRDMAGSFIPAIVNKATTTIDPTLREARDLVDKLKSRTPFMSRSLLPKRNIFGEEITFEGRFGPDIVSSIYMSHERDNPVAREMLRLHYYPEKPDFGRKLNGHKLTPEQYDRYVELSGKDATKKLTRRIALPSWQRMDEDRQMRIIKEVFQIARDDARDALKRQWPALRKKAADR